MAVRTAYDAVLGTALTAANLDRYPGGWIGYAESNAVQSLISSVQDLTSLSVTVTVGTARRIRVTAEVGFNCSNAGAVAGLQIVNGAGTICQQRNVHIPYTTSPAVCTALYVVSSPPSGANTWKLRAGLALGSGTIATDGSSTSPAMIVVEDIGPA